MRTRTWRRLVLLAAVLGVLVVPAGAMRADAVPMQVADDGLGTTGSTTYSVDPANRVIHVAVDLTATNLEPPTARGYYYFNSVGVLALAEAANAVATTDGGAPLGVSVEPVEGTSFFVFLVVDLPNQLLYQETHSIRLTYDLPDQGPRAAGFTRVNPAFAAVLPLPFGDPGSADVRVLVPDAYDVEVLGLSSMSEEDAGDHTALVATAIPDPFAFDASVIVRDSDALARTEVDGDNDISIAAWPGDNEWQTFVAGIVRDGVPTLEELIGQEWPVDDDLDIIETVAPYLYGYAGWYDGATGQIEVGDELDAGVVLHELAHAWFDRNLFTDRWINEGFAEEMASFALAELGHEEHHPQPIDMAGPGALRLNDWSTPALSSTISDEQETFGYNASLAVIRAVSNEIGIEGLRRVFAATVADQIAYQGDGEPEDWRFASDWQRLLDLLEEVGGSTGAAQLFTDYVVAPGDLPLLAERTAARTEYGELETAGGEWAPPFTVRRSMGQWAFGEAQEQMTQATQVLELRDEILATVEPLDLDPPVGLEEAYEESTDLEETIAEAEDFLAATERLVEAADAADDPGNILERIGRLGGSVDDDLASAEQAFVDDDAAALADAVDDTFASIDRAGSDGATRVGAGLAVVLLALCVRGLARLARHRKERRRAELDVMPAPGAQPTWPTPPQPEPGSEPAADT